MKSTDLSKGVGNKIPFFQKVLGLKFTDIFQNVSGIKFASLLKSDADYIFPSFKKCVGQ